MRGWILAAALSVAAGSAAAQGAEPRKGYSRVWSEGVLEIVVGDRVTARIPEDGGKPEIVSVVRAEPAEAAPPKPGKGTFADPPSGLVVFSLAQDGEQLRMKVETGGSRAFDYSARLVDNATIDMRMSRPAKACTVLPLLANYEAWASQADAVQLWDFRFRDTNEVVCEGPTPYPRPKPRAKTSP